MKVLSLFIQTMYVFIAVVHIKYLLWLQFLHVAHEVIGGLAVLHIYVLLHSCCQKIFIKWNI